MNRYPTKEKIRLQLFNEVKEKKHFHQDIELLYVLNGKLDIFMENQVISLEAENLYVINPNKQHELRVTEGVLYVQFLIAYELVSDVLKSTEFMFWCDSTMDESQEIQRLKEIIRKLLKHYLHGEGGVASFYYISLCYQMMDVLTMHFLVRSIDKEKSEDKDKFQERLNKINSYIWANYNQSISLQDLSKDLYLSSAYLSRFFKKNYGMTFAKYINHVRLYYAIDELLFTESSITRIAYDSGFSSLARFNKVFKEEYGKSPSAIRKSNAQTSLEEEKGNLAIINQQLETYFIEHEKMTENELPLIESKYSYSSHQVTELMPFWQDMINIGEASDLLQSELQEHVLLLKRNLKFKYLRFWNIFSKKLLIDIYAEEGEYNFSKLDAVLDFLVSNEIKAHIELTYKPKRIHESVQSTLLFEDNENVDVRRHHWERVMNHFMKHIVRRYGDKEISDWRLELWYDEWNLGTQKSIQDYFHLFNTSYAIIRNYNQDIKVGGCGIQTGYTLNLNKDFLEAWKKQAYFPDFISVMNYAYIRGEIEQEKYSKRSTDRSCLLHAVEKIKGDLEELEIVDVNLYVTEWNLTISDRNYINDTCFKAAYLIKNIIEVYGKVELLSYFLASDYISEYHDSYHLLYGGTGLLSKDSIFKPTAFAYLFLSQLKSYFIGKSSGHIITTDCQDSYAIVMHNQKDLNYNYYYTEEEKIDKKNSWKYFEDLSSLEMDIDLEDVKNGEYQIKIQRVNRHYGSVLDIWSELDFHQELSSNDVKYLKNQCNPKLTIQKVNVKDEKLKLKFLLEANEIMLVKIRYIKGQK
ncbi:MAG: GH39 family glycosyl hydrolase [Lactovum sp.]